MLLLTFPSGTTLFFFTLDPIPEAATQRATLHAGFSICVSSIVLTSLGLGQGSMSTTGVKLIAQFRVELQQVTA